MTSSLKYPFKRHNRINLKLNRVCKALMQSGSCPVWLICISIFCSPAVLKFVPVHALYIHPHPNSSRHSRGLLVFFSLPGVLGLALFFSSFLLNLSDCSVLSLLLRLLESSRPCFRPSLLPTLALTLPLSKLCRSCWAPVSSRSECKGWELHLCRCWVLFCNLWSVTHTMFYLVGLQQGPLECLLNEWKQG